MDHSHNFAQCSDCRLQASTIIRHHPTVEQVREQFDAITDGLRTNSDGQLFALIHQYDHHPSLVEAYHKWHSIISDGAINLNGINSHLHQQLPNEKQIKDATIAKMCRRIHQPNASLSTLVKSWAWTVCWNASKTSRRRNTPTVCSLLAGRNTMPFWITSCPHTVTVVALLISELGSWHPLLL